MPSGAARRSSLNCSDSDAAIRALLAEYPGRARHRDQRRRARGGVPPAHAAERTTRRDETRDLHPSYELLRAFRNRRFLIFSLGFPLVLYFADRRRRTATIDSLGGTGISAPLYYMVGLAAFGAMTAMLSTGARIAGERTVGWNRQLRITPLTHAALLPRQGADRLRDGAVDARRCCTLRASRSACSLPAGEWVRDDPADPGRAAAVRGARDAARASADGRLDRAGDRRRSPRSSPSSAARGSRSTSGVDARHRASASRRTGSSRQATSRSAARSWSRTAAGS